MEQEEALIIFQPKNESVKVPVGTNLIDAADSAGIIIPNICGKRGKCGKCKVKILQQELPYSQQEEITLSPEERSLGIHLACQINVKEDLLVEIIDEEEASTMNFLTYDLATEIESDQHIQKVYLEVNKPEINNQIDDLSNLEQSFNVDQSVVFTPLPVLQNLSTFLRKNDFKVTFVVANNQFINIEAGDTTSRLFGVAIDLGTTTVVGSVIDIHTGKVLGISAKTNPQSKYGEDVISRINYTVSEPAGLEKLQSSAIGIINKIIEELCEQASVDFREIYEISIAGNTIMNHLFLKVTPQYIAEAPYIPAFRKSQQFMAEELGITIQPRGLVTTLPNIAGYVGGDITGFILASEIYKNDKITLGIDIGTNGEIVLGSKDKLLACSAAAGPAFEGGHIKNGMRAMAGAIDKYTIDSEQIFYHVIGETEAIGICGTGLIDIIAELLKIDLINETGKLLNNNHIPDWLKGRITQEEEQNSFVVVPKNETRPQKEILLTQKDIRELQLGKGAIAAGIEILCQELGITENKIDEILIAGAFGSYLNKYSAKRIGLIPNLPVDRVKFVGNAASLGAKKYMLSSKMRKDADYILEMTKYIELSSRESFQEIFAEKMLFGNSKDI